MIPAAARQVPAGGVIIAGPPARADGAENRVRLFLYDEFAPAYDPVYSLVHETGHMLGLPDLYVLRANVTYHSRDIMASGATPDGFAFPGGMVAWHRWKLGWIDPQQLACLNGRRRVDATVTPLERPGGVKAIVFRGSRFACVAEVRQRIAEDARICRTGVLIYRVDFAAGAGAADIALAQARSDGPGPTSRCGFQAGAPFKLGRGEIKRRREGPLLFELVRALPDGSYRIRVTRR